MRKTVLLCFVSGLAALLVSCGKPGLISERTYQNYNQMIVVESDTTYQLSMADLYEKVYNSNLLRYGGALDTSAIRTFLDSVVVDTLIGLRARQIRLEDYYNQRRLYKARLTDVLIREFLKVFVYDRVVYDSAKAVEFYLTHPEYFAVPEQVNLFQILVIPDALRLGPDSAVYANLTDEELTEAAGELARKIRSEVTDSTSFATAAMAYSDDRDSKLLGGYVGWTKRGQYIHPFDSIAFSLGEGGVSDPYLDQTGWHILYIDRHIDSGIPPLTEETYPVARQSYTNYLINQTGRELMDSLFAGVSVTYNESLLDTNLFLVDVQQWVAVVNDVDTIDCNEARTPELTIRRKYGVDNSTPEMKKEMLQRVAERYAIIQAARKNGIDTLPAVVTEEHSLRHKYSRSIIDNDRYDPTWEPPDSVIEAYYNGHLSEFAVEKPLVVQHIIAQDSSYGEFIRDQALSGVDFLELARKYYPGEESIREELADLGPIAEGDVPPEFYAAVSRIQEGQITHPVKTEYGYHIIKLIKRSDTRDIGEARSQIIRLLRQQHREQIFEQYKQDAFREFGIRFPAELRPFHLKPLELRQNADGEN